MAIEGGGGGDGDSDDDWDDSDDWSESEDEALEIEMGLARHSMKLEMSLDDAEMEMENVSGSDYEDLLLRATVKKEKMIKENELESIFAAQQKVRDLFKLIRFVCLLFMFINEQDGSWIIDDISLVKLDVGRIKELLQQAGAKSLGNQYSLSPVCCSHHMFSYRYHSVFSPTLTSCNSAHSQTALKAAASNILIIAILSKAVYHWPHRQPLSPCCTEGNGLCCRCGRPVSKSLFPTGPGPQLGQCSQ